jgi:aspartate/methionine/tyrosine aminotransferase
MKMHIQSVNNYSTDIHDILELANNENAYFISSWDKNDHILNIDANLIEQSIHQQEHKNTYIMSKDMEILRNQISLYFNEQGIETPKDCITIVSNGTSAAFISLLQIFKRGATNFLFIGPIYFTYLHLLNIFGKRIYHYDINLFEEITFDFTELEKSIQENDIHSLILIQPFFGSGIVLNDLILEKFISLCEKQHIYLLIDYVYGNMEWNSFSHIHNTKLTQMVINSDFCILYESISKRIFLNGMKSAVIFSSSKFISDINIDSEICLGSISYIQESLLHTIYSPNNITYVNQFVINALDYASNNYNLLCTFILGTDFKLCKSTCGYFTLLGIPKIHFNSLKDQDIINELYTRTGIVTIPHSRYYYNSSEYYCFRINLATETYELLNAMEKLLHICSNSSDCDIC